MARKSQVGAARGLYAGLTLAEWRGSVRALLSSGWWVFGARQHARDSASTLHFAVVQAAALLLPTSWHKAHAGRLSPEYYRNRRDQVNARAAFLHPRTNQGGSDGTPAV